MAIDPTSLASGQVVTGFSFPVVALYSAQGETVTYSSGRDLARGVSLDPQIETTDDDNTFYANNRAAESAQRRFRNGTLGLTVDGLLIDSEKLIMGLGSEAASTVSVGQTTVNMTDYGESQEIPYVGVGAVVRSQSNGVELFRAVIYPKVRFEQFTVPAETQGESIDWQTTELSGRLNRDDTAKHNWQRVSEPLATELEAYNVVRVVLGLEPAEALPVV